MNHWDVGSGASAGEPISALECASRLFGLGGLLRSTWRRISPRDRDALLTDLTSYAAMLRDTLDPARADGMAGPTEEDVRAQLKAPTSQVYLQPIVWLPTREVVGFEALTRFAAWTPDRWFQRAWEAGVGLEFELQAVKRVLPTLADLPSDIYLAVNVAPLTLLSTDLVKLLRHASPHRIVLELTEHAPIDTYDLYRPQLRRLRKLGVRIAVDDAGAGHASLQHIIQLGPDIIKLDRILTSNCHKDPVRRSLLRCLATFASQTKTCLLAEGVETVEEADALISHGVAFGQGYYFGRPERHATLAVSAELGGWLVAPAAN